MSQLVIGGYSELSRLLGLLMEIWSSELGSHWFYDNGGMSYIHWKNIVCVMAVYCQVRSDKKI